MLLALQLNNLLEVPATPVEVPDVVGDLQAAGTLELETALFVVAVSTAYSPSVAVGVIISQSPAGGAFAGQGSTVTITVSLGPVSDTQPSGGWGFLNHYELDLKRRRKRDKERRELEEQTERIEASLDRDIAQLLREQEAIDDKRQDFERLAKLAKENADLEAARQYSERVAKALERVIAQGNYSAIEALDRELKRAQEDEEFLLLSITLLVD